MPILVDTQPVPSPSHMEPIRHSSRIIHKPAWLHDFVSSVQTSYLDPIPSQDAGMSLLSSTALTFNSSYSSFLNNIYSTIKPSSFCVACKDPNWIKAMDQELATLEQNGTWILSTLPKG